MRVTFKNKVIICIILICMIFAVIFIANNSFKKANASTSVEYASLDAEIDLDEIITSIEDSLAEKGTNVITELYNQKINYEKLLLTSADNDCVKIQSFIEQLDFQINEYDAYLQRKNASIQVFSLRDTELRAGVSAIIAGFYADGLTLSAELLSHMMDNTISGSSYVPDKGQRIKETKLIKEELAYNNEVVATKGFTNPGGWAYLLPTFFKQIEVDAYTSLGSGFAYQKLYYDANNVKINIKDRYDFEYNGSKLNDLCAEAEERGILTPFYTVINDIIVPGTVPFNHQISGNVAVITGMGNVTGDITIPAMIRQFGYEDSINDNYMPPLNVKIGNSAFLNNMSLNDIILAESWIGDNEEKNEVGLVRNIIQIGNNAFENCTQLSVIEIPNSVKEIGIGAFKNCTSLQSIGKLDNLVSIGEYAFYNCKSLKTIEIPLSTTHIGQYAFYGCEKLVIHCKSNSKLSTWHTYWNLSNCSVIWGYEDDVWATVSNGYLPSNVPIKLNLDFDIKTGNANEDNDWFQWYNYGEIELIGSTTISFMNLEITISVVGGELKIKAKNYYSSSWGDYVDFVDWRLAQGTTIKHYKGESSWKTVSNGELSSNAKTRLNLEVCTVTGNDDQDDSYYEWYSLGWIEFTGSITQSFSQLYDINPITIKIVDNKLKVSANFYYVYGYYIYFVDWRLASGTSIQQYKM